jgi:hypothetical protein
MVPAIVADVKTFTGTLQLDLERHMAPEEAAQRAALSIERYTQLLRGRAAKRVASGFRGVRRKANGRWEARNTPFRVRARHDCALATRSSC